jgi:transposase
MQRWQASGSAPAQPSDGSRSPLDDHAATVLGLIEDQPDLTLDEVCARLREAGIAASCSAVSRFFDRHGISFKNVWPAPGPQAVSR